jgi:alginate O-acetyltransferase complex protein AlgI
MSLSRWFRDYLYIPLGGNRGSTAQTYRNLMIVFLAVGVWHGANWTFVAWGAYHGTLLLVERALGIGRGEARGLGLLSRARTVGLVLFGWILFRAAGLGYAAAYAAALLRPGGGLDPSVDIALTVPAQIALLVGCASVLLPGSWVTGVRLERGSGMFAGGLRLATATVVLPVAMVVVVASTFSPFLYFRF